MSDVRKKRMDGISPRKKRTSAPRSFGSDSTSTKASRTSLSSSKNEKTKKFLQKPISIPLYSGVSGVSSLSQARSVKNFILINWFWLRYVCMFFAVALGIIILAEYRAQTKIVLTPHLEYLEIHDTVTAYNNPKEGALGFDIIAVTDEASIPVLMLGTEKKEIKARNEISIYNDFSSEPQRLSKKTRFMDSEGKIFFLGEQDIVVPGKEGETPGTIAVMVTAEKPGDEYNIDPTDFTIPGFKEAGSLDKYEAIYGRSSKKFVGGFIGTEGFVNQDQKLQTEQELREKLQQRLEMRLSKENTDEVIIISNSAHLRYKETEFITDIENKTGVLSQKGTIVAVAISRSALEPYLKETYLTLENDEQAHTIDSRALDVKVAESFLDFTSEPKSLTFRIDGEMLLQWDVNIEHVHQQLKGVELSQTPSLFSEMNSIDMARVDIFPPWKNNVSTTKERIQIQVD